MQGPGMRRLEPGGTRTRVDSQLSTPALPHLLGPRGGAALRFMERYSPGRGFGGRAGAHAPAWCVTGRGERGAARRSRPGVVAPQPLPPSLHLPCPAPCTARCTPSARRSPMRWRSPPARPSWCWSEAARTGGWQRGRAVVRRATCLQPTCAACR